MPLLQVTTSRKLEVSQEESLSKRLSLALSEDTGKAEKYVMIILTSGSIMLAGKITESVFIDIRGIGGFNREVNTMLTKDLCLILREELDVPSENIYITFTDVPAVNWGWDNKLIAES